LVDIRSAQEAYEEANGKYTNNFDTLIEWVKKPAVAIPYSSGTYYTDTMSEQSYYEQGFVLTLAEVDSIALASGYTPDEFSDLISEDGTAYKVRDNIFTSFFPKRISQMKNEQPKSYHPLI